MEELTHEQFMCNADGVPHYAYYDKPRQLSFVWDGSWEHPIQVCPGGYGEDPKDQIWPDIPRASLMTASPNWWLKWFEDRCRQYMREVNL